MNKFNLLDICFVNDINEENQFIGLKIKNNQPKIFFPKGYELPTNVKNLRYSVKNLIYVLSTFKKKYERNCNQNKNIIDDFSFPFDSYLIVLDFFISNGYYKEKHISYKINGNGKINWTKTIQKIKPIIEKNNITYLKTVNKKDQYNYDNILTLIHKFLVWDSLNKIGWLYNINIQEKPIIKFNKSLFKKIIMKKLNNVYNDKEKRLFKAMLSIVEKYDSINNNLKEITYGTFHFNLIWEFMLDSIFGVKDKNRFFPQSFYFDKKSKNKYINDSLRPDVIMIDESNNYYVIDAKYYLYGITNKKEYLPSTSSICKQIIYAEYIENNFKIEPKNIFNVFILPFNRNDNYHKTTEYLYKLNLIGQLNSRKNNKNYEKINVVLLDTKTTMEVFQIKENIKIRKKLINELLE